MTPGYKTTEFYAVLAGIGTLLVSFVQQNCSFSQDKVVALIFLVGSYVGSRTILKYKNNQATPTNTQPQV